MTPAPSPVPSPLLPLGLILWPGFVAAVLGCAVVFAFLDPADLAGLPGRQWTGNRLAAYSAGFLIAWATTSLASALTWLLLRPAPPPPARLDEDAADD